MLCWLVNCGRGHFTVAEAAATKIPAAIHAQGHCMHAMPHAALQVLFPCTEDASAPAEIHGVAYIAVHSLLCNCPSRCTICRRKPE